MLKRYLLLVLTLVLCTSMTFAADYNPDRDYVLKLHKILDLNFTVSQKIYNNEPFIQDAEKLDAETEALIEEVISCYDLDDLLPLQQIMDEMENLDPKSKLYVQDTILSAVREYEVSNDKDYLRTEDKPQYLPGYGYTDVDYMYKLGQELDMSIIQTYWKKEKRRIESGKTYRYYVKMEIAAEMGASVGGDANVAAFKIKGEAHFTINGKLEKFSEVEMTLKETVETSTMLMYEKRQVWFELFKMHKNDSNENWELAGKCYLFKEFPAQTEIIIDADGILHM